MGIIRQLRKWREEPDGTLKGPSLQTDSGVILTEEDLSSRNGRRVNEYATHDGTGTADAGLYRWNGTEWDKVGGSTLI